MATSNVKAVGDGFWNIRGTFRVGLIDIGTHASLVRLADGRHVFLDAYTLDDETRAWADSIVGPDGPAAIINLHPFHTVHVRKMAAAFPNAKLYGTARHHQRFTELTWEPQQTETSEFAELFDADFAFTVPRGVELVPDNENFHFASVLAVHRPSRVLHVDDTLTIARLPKPLGAVLGFHPTLRFVLEKRAGAAADFRGWTTELIDLCRQVGTICAAHNGILRGDDIQKRVTKVVRGADRLLARHERRHG